MCGIFALTPQNDRTIRVAPYLSWEIEDRGRDSWGATNGVEIHREMGKITDNFQMFPGWENALYHTRQSSVGAVTLENCHPFRVEKDGTVIVGVHNGSVGNHADLNKEYNRNCTVDSQHIFHHLAEGRSLDELHAWGVAAWFENGSPELHFLKFTSSADWYVGELKETGEFIMCSYRTPIERAARMNRLGAVDFYHIKPGLEYIIRNSKICEFEEIYKPTVRAVTTTNNFPHIYSGSNSTFASTYEPCIQCRVRYIDSTKYLVCESCFKILTKVEGVVPPIIWRSNGKTQEQRVQS